MPTAPHIHIYEIVSPESSREIGSLCAPDGFYAMAAAMTYVEPLIDTVKTKEQQAIAACFARYVEHANKSDFAALDWYFTTCGECGILAEKKEWIAQRRDFSKRVMGYLLVIIFQGHEIEPQSAKVNRAILQLFACLIDEEIKDRGIPLSMMSRIFKIVLFPVFPLLDRLVPRAARNLTTQDLRAGLEVLHQLLHYMHLSTDENRVFTFEQPADQIEDRVSFGGFQMGTDRQGRTVLGG